MNLSMENISMSFDCIRALDNVNFSVGDNEIHGLLGENGAGKSTLMNILAGIHTPLSGRIFIDGQEIKNMTPKKALSLGIRFIHQELSLINDLTVYQNLFLTEEIMGKSRVFLDKKSMVERSETLLAQMKLDIDPTVVVSELDTSRKQSVEIAKAMLFKARLIIMDEPTTALTNKEISVLFELMLSLKNKGVSMIYISHKMPELFKICDKYTVLRDGKLISTGCFKDINELKATEMLVGKCIAAQEEKQSAAQEQVCMEAKNLTCKGFFEDVSFQIRKGEVVAFTGLFGDGRGQLSEALFGSRKIDTGEIYINGKPLKKHEINSVMRSGVGMVQRSRKERSVIKDLSILDNVSIASYVKSRNRPFRNRKEEVRQFEELQKVVGIKYSKVCDYITALSGGNQQKVIVARWLALDSDVYILDNPTQGIDVGAKFEIYKLINELAGKGKSILIFSSEFTEINKVADRCIIMYKGKINAELSRSELNEMNVMYYSTGSNVEEVRNEQAEC